MRSYHYYQDGVHALYVNGMLRSMVFALVGIFTPIFIYREIYSATNLIWISVAAVAAFYLIIRMVVLLIAIPASALIARIGFRRSILVSAVCLAIYLISLKLAPMNLWYFVVAAICGGLNIPMYWIARGSVISQDGNKSQIGHQMGWMLTIEQIVSMLGPITAALIIVQWGFSTLYSMGFVVLCLSVVPLWHMHGHTHINGASWRGFIYWTRDRRYFHQAVGIAAKAVDDYVIANMWPLAIMLMGWHATALGGLFSAVSIVAIIVRILTVKLFDKWRKRGDYSDEAVFGVAATMSSIVWVVRMFIVSAKSILSVDLIGAIFGTLYSSMFIDYEHLGGIRMGSIAYWVYAEMVYSISTITLMILMIIGAYYGIWKEVVLLAAALWTMMGMIQARESNMK